MFAHYNFSYIYWTLITIKFDFIKAFKINVDLKSFSSSQSVLYIYCNQWKYLLIQISQ